MVAIDFTVRYPHQRHGLAGKPSNSSKKDATAAFMEFVYTAIVYQNEEKLKVFVPLRTYYQSLEQFRLRKKGYAVISRGSPKCNKKWPT